MIWKITVAGHGMLVKLRPCLRFQACGWGCVRWKTPCRKECGWFVKLTWLTLMYYYFWVCTSYWYPSSVKQRHGNRRRVYELPLPPVELNLTKANFIRGASSLRTANSPCPVCLFTLLDASIDRHFALSVKSLNRCEYLERDFIWITYTLDVWNM